MKFENFLEQFHNYPVIDTENILSGTDKTKAEKVQISRWVKAEKIVQLKRGYYLFSKNYRTREPFKPYLASLLVYPSYLSCEKALEFYGLIPEGVPVYTSITTKRQSRLTTQEGTFEYRHIRPELFWGYKSVSQDSQTGFIAYPEKALLDFFYFGRIHYGMDFIEELRLQNLETINKQKLKEFALRFNKTGIVVLADMLIGFIESEIKAAKTL